MHDVTDYESLAIIKKLKLTMESISSLIKLFFTIHKEERIITPSINSTLKGLYQKLSSFIVFVFVKTSPT